MATSMQQNAGLRLVNNKWIVLLLFVYEVVVLGQTFRSSQAGLQLSECFFFSFPYAVFSTFNYETDHRNCEMTLGGWHCGVNHRGWQIGSSVSRKENLCVSRKVFLKHQVNWNTVCGAIRELPWRNIWLSDNPVEVLNEHISMLVGRYVPTKVIRVRNKDKPWFDDQCRHAFGLKQEAHLRWTRDRSRVNWK